MSERQSCIRLGHKARWHCQGLCAWGQHVGAGCTVGSALLSAVDTCKMKNGSVGWLFLNYRSTIVLRAAGSLLLLHSLQMNVISTAVRVTSVFQQERLEQRQLSSPPLSHQDTAAPVNTRDNICNTCKPLCHLANLFLKYPTHANAINEHFIINLGNPQLYRSIPVSLR